MPCSRAKRFSYLQPDEMDELRRRLVDHAEEVAIACLGEPSKRTRREMCWGRNNGSLSVATAGHKRGLWNDRGSGEKGGDLLRLIERRVAGSFPKALEWALAFTGYVPPSRAAGLTPAQRRDHAVLLRQDAERRAAERAQRKAADAVKCQAEDAVQVARAQAMWDRRRPLSGTPAWTYLTETRRIPEPADGFPLDLAWHPGERALIMAIRSPSGAVTAVQIVRLTRHGEKRRGPLPKKTIGRLKTAEGRSFLKLPVLGGADENFLQHAEGGETGLSAWVATGVETWVAFGAGMRPEPGRMNIMLADDDAAESDRAAALAKQIAEWTKQRLSFCVASPWEQPRGDSEDFNDVLQKGGRSAVYTRIRKAVLSMVGVMPAEAPRQLPTASLKSAQFSMTRILREFFWPQSERALPAHWLFPADCGSGKAELAGHCMVEGTVRAKKEGRRARYLYLVWDHRVGAQIAQRFRRMRLTVEHFRGRGNAFHPEPNAPCQNLEAVKHAILAGQPIKPSCCGQGCPIFDAQGCQFLESEKRAVQADVVVMAHTHLRLSLSQKILDNVDAIIIDEDFQSVFDWRFHLTTQIFSKEMLDRWPVMTDGEPDVDATRDLAWIRQKIIATFEACLDGYVLADTLKAAGLDAYELARGRKLEWRRKRDADMTPGMPLEQRGELARSALINVDLPKIAAVYDALEAILSDGDAGAGRAELQFGSSGHGAARFIYVNAQRRLAEWAESLPVLMLNGTGRIEEVRRTFPRATECRPDRIETPHGSLVQILGGFAKTSMTDPKLADLKAFLTVLFPGRSVGLVGHKDTIGTFTDMPNARWAWHGSTAGDDSFRDVDVLAVFDGLRASPKEIAALAAARTGCAVKPDDPIKGRRTALMTDGLGVSVPVFRYEDPHAQAVHESILQSSVDQAVSRLRQVRRTERNPCICFLFGMVAPEGAVSQLVRWADVKPDRLVHMASRKRILTNSADMVAWHDDLFETEKAAADARDRFGDCERRVMQMVSRDPEPWSEVRFQVAGQGQKPRTGFCPSRDVKAMRAEAIQHYGELVHWTQEQISAGGPEDIPKRYKIDLWEMGMTSRLVPAVAAFALPPPPADPASLQALPTRSLHHAGVGFTGALLHSSGNNGHPCP